jgi:hypothetical protein
METSAVAAVCGRGCAWSAVRVISDLVTDHPDAAVLGLANADGSPNTVAALRFMASHPVGFRSSCGWVETHHVRLAAPPRPRRLPAAWGSGEPEASRPSRSRKRSANVSNCPAAGARTRYPNPASIHFSTWR